MRRRIEFFTQDDLGDWVAHLDCLHRQHVRHAPPFREAPWVLDELERAAHVGSPIDCPLCDRAELPADLDTARVTGTWNEETVPAALQRDHRIAARTWGLVHVTAGSVRFRAATTPPIDRIVTVGAPQAIPPEVAHAVEPVGPVNFHVEFLRRPVRPGGEPSGGG